MLNSFENNHRITLDDNKHWKHTLKVRHQTLNRSSIAASATVLASPKLALSATNVLASSALALSARNVPAVSVDYSLIDLRSRNLYIYISDAKLVFYCLGDFWILFRFRKLNLNKE